MSTKFLNLPNVVILQKARHHVSLQDCGTHSMMEDKSLKSCHVMCDLRHHVHDPVHAAAAVELHRVVRDGAVLGPLQQRHRRLP